MPDFNVVNTNAPVTGESHVVACWKCAQKFNAAAALWCDCAAKTRTLECPHCSTCFCQAPFIYKRKFWDEAPTALREHTRRFRIPVGDAVAPSGAAASSARRPHVLIVDDEEPIRSLAACYVEEMGYEATTVSSPEEALLATAAISYDVVLTDALMPKMDGRELSRQLKELHGGSLKVVLMTSLYTARRFRAEARNVFKVDEYLAKPFTFEDLRAALQRVAPVPTA